MGLKQLKKFWSSVSQFDRKDKIKIAEENLKALNESVDQTKMNYELYKFLTGNLDQMMIEYNQGLIMSMSLD